MKTKILLVLFVTFNILSCSKDSSDDDNESFTFQVEVQNVTDRDATITWSRPEGSNITYKIYLNDELLEENFGQTSYTFTDLPSETNYSGKIIATNGNKIATVNFSFFTEPYIPNIYNGHVFLHSQDQVNEFGSSHYNIIEYDLIIDSHFPITDLSPLSDLREVKGTLKIIKTSMETLRGLENLESVGLELYIFNTNLKNLSHLQNLTHIGGNIEIFSNAVLEDVNGLQNVRNFNAALQISNSQIKNLNILNDATTLEQIYITENHELLTIDGLQNVETITGNVDIFYNENLHTINGLGSIISIGGSLFLDYNLSLLNIGLTSLVSIEGHFGMYQNFMLSNLNELSNLESFQSLQIIENTELKDFCGITSAVLNFNQNLNISDNQYNPTLEDFINGNCSL